MIKLFVYMLIIYKIIEDYTDAVVDYYWDGKSWNYRVNYDGTVRSDIIEANYGKLDDTLFLQIAWR